MFSDKCVKKDKVKAVNLDNQDVGEVWRLWVPVVEEEVDTDYTETQQLYSL